MQGFTVKTYGQERQILFNVGSDVNISVGIVVSATGVDPNSEGKKIIKAGTPMTGSLVARTTPFTEAATASGASNAVGVLLHDVDLTLGDNNATLLIDGFVDLDKLDADVLEKITTEVKTALPHVRFLK